VTTEQRAIERLEKRKQELAEETAEVEFLLEAARKRVTKRVYDPAQLADARKKRWEKGEAE